jgi:hypothetical protein
MSERNRRLLRIAAEVADFVTIVVIAAVTIWAFLQFLDTAPEWAMWMMLLIGGWQLLTSKEV